MKTKDTIVEIIESRASLVRDLPTPDRFETEAKVDAGGRDLRAASGERQAHLRTLTADAQPGKRRGGGIAAMGFDPECLAFLLKFLKRTNPSDRRPRRRG